MQFDPCATKEGLQGQDGPVARAMAVVHRHRKIFYMLASEEAWDNEGDRPATTKVSCEGTPSGLGRSPRIVNNLSNRA